MLEFHISKVDESYRVVVPQTLQKCVSWLIGDKSIDGWLVLASPQRCRLLSSSEVKADQHLQMLQERITTELGTTFSSGLEFQEQEAVALALRLMPLQVKPFGAKWRLTFPKPIATIMRITPAETEVATLFVQGHIEFWTLEGLRSSVCKPLSQMI